MLVVFIAKGPKTRKEDGINCVMIGLGCPCSALPKQKRGFPRVFRGIGKKARKIMLPPSLLVKR